MTMMMMTCSENLGNGEMYKLCRLDISCVIEQF